MFPDRVFGKGNLSIFNDRVNHAQAFRKTLDFKKPVCCGVAAPADDTDNFVEIVVKRTGEDRFVMSDPVAELPDFFDTVAQIGAALIGLLTIFNLPI